jgi:hypothetical protein
MSYCILYEYAFLGKDLKVGVRGGEGLMPQLGVLKVTRANTPGPENALVYPSQRPAGPKNTNFPGDLKCWE